MEISPIQFVPRLLSKVWGGRRLGRMLHKSLPDDSLYGESWEISDHASHAGRIADGPLTGMTLRDLMRNHRRELLGPAGETSIFPLLVKFLDAQDWLSVQVHPNDEQAQRHCPGERGKTEAWFVLHADAGSRIYAGLLPGVDVRALRSALLRGTVTECLHSYEPTPGDCLYLPAGTVHAVGGGVLMAEVQQTSDATFRLFDWNRVDDQGRSRALHVEPALACIDWRRGPIEPRRSPWYSQMPADKTERHRLAECRYFVADDVRGSVPFTVAASQRLEILVVLQGRGRLVTPHGEKGMDVGDTWLLPADSPAIECVPTPSLGALLISPN